MKPNQRGRFNGRHNNGNALRAPRSQVIFRNTSLESTGPCGKLRGTALQLHEKYLAAAKDAQIQNDDILAETCLQYADHYMHIQNQAIANEQALHAQQQATRSVQQVETVPPETLASESTDSPVEAESETLKVVDLSIPMDVLNAKSDPSSGMQPQQGRRTLRPRGNRQNLTAGASETFSSSTEDTSSSSHTENNT